MLLFYLSSFFFFIISLFFLNFGLFMLMMNFSLFIDWGSLMVNSVSFNMFILLDWISLFFIFTVLIISSMILMYCSEYMIHDKYVDRFFYLLFFFIISMLVMIISPNLVSILIGWDGLGLVSYCLVIYYQSFSSYNSGMLTVLINRIGDVFIILSISLMFFFGSWNFVFLNSSGLLLMIFLVIAAFTKSAQFPFSSWLPMAMAAPTPVSSLVHSSTLVTAGVYLLIRHNYLIYKFSNLMIYILFSGLVTMMFSGFSANFEFDIKKIIAYSTLSQLGLMMMIFSMKMWELAYFHLLIHAMFKSMMFMCSGVIIHGMGNFQDIRFMGKIKDFMPLTSLIFMLSNMSLCGLPFMSGFFSKDKILEFFFNINFSFFLYFFVMLSTGLTVSYSVRLLYYLMNLKFKFLPMSKVSDFKLMNYSMFFLMLMSLMLGSMMNWLLFLNVENIFMLKIEKLMIFFLCFMFFYIGGFVYKMPSFYVSFFFGKMWFLYNLNKIITMNSLYFGKYYLKVFDKGWSEYYFKNSIYLFSKKLKFMDYLNINFLMSYVLFISYLIMMIFMIFI